MLASSFSSISFLPRATAELPDPATAPPQAPCHWTLPGLRAEPAAQEPEEVATAAMPLPRFLARAPPFSPTEFQCPPQEFAQAPEDQEAGNPKHDEGESGPQCQDSQGAERACKDTANQGGSPACLPATPREAP